MIHGLGRRAAIDHRDHDHLLSAPRVPALRVWRNWYDTGWIGDQADTSQCVGYAWSHFIEASPTTHPALGAEIDPAVIYRGAQRFDEWSGEDYEGTSVRAGAKYLQSIGVIGEYLWAFDVDVLCKNLLEVGPVVLGIDWYDSFFDPDAKGNIYLGGDVAGGHALLATGYHKIRRRIRLRNSWGLSWGIAGHCWIGVDDVARLLAADGEACLALETRV